MIDLKKLEQKFDALFEQETEETFKNWLHNKILKEALASMGKGSFREIGSIKDIPAKEFIYNPINILFAENLSTLSCNTQYAMAA